MIWTATPHNSRVSTEKSSFEPCLEAYDRQLLYKRVQRSYGGMTVMFKYLTQKEK